MRAGPLFTVLCVLSSLALGACDDPTGFGATPEVVQDTFLIGAPTEANADLPTALDVTVGNFGGIAGGVFPERVDQAQQFDVAIRVQGGALVFAPPRVLGLKATALRRAGITEPITDRIFEQVREAPPSSSFIMDRTVPVREGAVYVVRSRSVQGCIRYAKIAPLEVDRALDRVRLVVATNTFCEDTRLFGKEED